MPDGTPSPAWPARLEVAVAERAFEGELRSGDLAVLLPRPGGALVVAIDGLGHGAAAAEASTVARGVLEAGPELALPALIERCHSAMTGTRGAVMTLAAFDLERGLLVWTGVGNVEGRLVRAESGAQIPTEGPFLRGGVVGHQLPSVRETTTDLRDGDLLVLTTDGIASGYAGSLRGGGPVQRIADRILDAHGKPTDDALVVVVRHRAVP